MNTSTYYQQQQQKREGNNTKSAIYDDPKYRCCCGMHVQKAARIVAIVGIALSTFALAVVVGFVTLIGSPRAKDKEGKNIESSPIYLIVGQTISVLSCVAILYAKQKQKPSLYLPFLITQAIGLVGCAIYIVLTVVIMAEGSSAVIDSGDEELDVHLRRSKASPGVTLVIYCFAIAFTCWIYSLVYRAYMFAKAEKQYKLTALPVVIGGNGGIGSGDGEFLPPPQYTEKV